MDRRASQLQQEYLRKARASDRLSGTDAGTVGRVEAKLVSLGCFRGVVCDAWGEVSEHTHALLQALTTSRVRVAGPSTGKRGLERTEEGERSIVIGYLRRALSVATVKAQAFSLLGRLEGLGPGAAAACSRRLQAAELDRQWRRQLQAIILSQKQGFSIHRGGFAKVD